MKIKISERGEEKKCWEGSRVCGEEEEKELLPISFDLAMAMMTKGF